MDGWLVGYSHLPAHSPPPPPHTKEMSNRRKRKFEREARANSSHYLKEYECHNRRLCSHSEQTVQKVVRREIRRKKSLCDEQKHQQIERKYTVKLPLICVSLKNKWAKKRCDRCVSRTTASDETTETNNNNNTKHKIQSTWYKGNFLKFFSKSSIWYITFKCLLKYKNHLYSYLYFIQTFSPAKFTTPQHIRPELKTVCVTADGYRYCVRCAVFRSPRRNYNATQRKERRRRKKWATPTKETRYQCSLILSECVRFFSSL